MIIYVDSQEQKKEWGKEGKRSRGERKEYNKQVKEKKKEGNLEEYQF